METSSHYLSVPLFRTGATTALQWRFLGPTVAVPEQISMLVLFSSDLPIFFIQCVCVEGVYLSLLMLRTVSTLLLCSSIIRTG